MNRVEQAPQSGSSDDLATLPKLHLGCGPVVVDGWVNLDKSPNVLISRFKVLGRLLARLGLITGQQAEGFPPGVKIADLAKPLPYADDSVGLIYSAHLIEHMSKVNAMRLLRECRRVLAPGGMIRFATPDLREFVDAYRANADASAADGFMRKMGTYVDADGGVARRFVNRNISAFHHQWLYDESSLRALFEECGFHDVEARQFRDAAFPDLEQLELRSGGLFVQATG